MRLKFSRNRGLRHWIEDFLACPSHEIAKIRSVVFSGRIHQGDLMDLENIFIVERDLPVDFVQTGNAAESDRSVSP
jgi:hypothetical protein